MDTLEKIQFLKSVPLLEGLTEEDIRRIAESAQEKAFPAGAAIFKENEEGDVLYIIARGSVRILKGTGKSLLLTILNEKDFFGEMVIFDREKRSATVEAQTDVALLTLEREKFLLLLAAWPKIALTLLKTLSSRLREMHQEMVQVHSLADHYKKKLDEKK